MELQQIKKLKTSLEEILTKLESEAKIAGIGIKSPGFQKKLTSIKSSMLKRFAVDKNTYDNIDELIKKQEKGLKKATIKSIFGLAEVKTQLKKLEEKPEVVQFRQDDIKSLPFSQLEHIGLDHVDIMAELEILAEKDKELLSIITAVSDKYKAELKTELSQIKHSSLKGIGPNDHHDKYHNIESHVDSTLKKQLERLTGGDYVDDLHKHYFLKPLQGAGEPWGITQGDCDARYVALAGSTMTGALILSGEPVVDLQAATKKYVDDSVFPDEKVKYDAGDPTAGYLSAKVVAGNGITLSEGIGADENKLKISATWLLDPVEEEWDITAGLPVDPEVGDRYISDGTDAGLGWYDGYIYEWDGEEWVETLPIEGMMVWLIFEMVWWVFMSGGWMEVGEDTFVPYAGATSNVDLGDNRIILSSVTQPKITVSDTAPASPSVNDLWVDIS